MDAQTVHGTRGFPRAANIVDVVIVNEFGRTYVVRGLWRTIAPVRGPHSFTPHAETRSDLGSVNIWEPDSFKAAERLAQRGGWIRASPWTTIGKSFVCIARLASWAENAEFDSSRPDRPVASSER